MGVGRAERAPRLRVALSVMMALSVVLAGCSGLGGLGGGDDSTDSADSAATAGAPEDVSDGTSIENADSDVTGDGDETSGDGGDGAGNSDSGGPGNSGSDGDDGSGGSGASGSNGGNSKNVVVPLAEDIEDTQQWFNLSAPGRYEFEIETAEEGTGKMSFETSPADDGQVTVDTHYELGEESTDSSVTGPVGEAQGQLATSPGFQYLILLSLSGIGPAAQLGGGDLEVGNELQRNNDGGTYSVTVAETRNYGGVECYFIETRTNGTLSNEVCTQGAFQSAPYVATYNESGLKQRIELTDYESG